MPGGCGWLSSWRGLASSGLHLGETTPAVIFALPQHEKLQEPVAPPITRGTRFAGSPRPSGAAFRQPIASFSQRPDQPGCVPGTSLIRRGKRTQVEKRRILAQTSTVVFRLSRDGGLKPQPGFGAGATCAWCPRATDCYPGLRPPLGMQTIIPHVAKPAWISSTGSAQARPRDMGAFHSLSAHERKPHKSA